MFRSLLALVVVAGFVTAEDKKDEKPMLKGTWTREANGITVDIKFGKAGEVAFIAMAGDNGITVNCSYSVAKDGTIKAKVKSSEEVGSFPAKPANGTEFSFKIKIDGKSAKVTDFEGKDVEGGKEAIEGEYTSKDK